MTLNESEMRAYREARKDGLPPSVALYAARPAALELDWLSHYQVDGEWADFEYEGRKFRVRSTDPAVIEGQCESCAELVKAWREKDDGMAWLTDDEYAQMDHRTLTVTMLDADDEETPHDASLWGVCGLRRTNTETRTDDRFVADTVLELAHEAAESNRLTEEAMRREQLARETRFGELVENITEYAETLAMGTLTRGEFFDRTTLLLHTYLDEEN